MPSARTIVCFGDSNTHGTIPMRDLYDVRRYGPDERWPGVMSSELGAGWHIKEEGLPGRTTVHDDPIEGIYKNGIATLPAILETHAPIDIVTLMLGTNDLKIRFSVMPGDIATSLELLVRMILSSESGTGRKPPGLLIVAPPPILETGCLGSMFSGGAAKSGELGALYAALAERHGAGFLDAGKVIRSSTVDGIHFDAEEHEKLGLAMAEAVARLAAD